MRAGEKSSHIPWEDMERSSVGEVRPREEKEPGLTFSPLAPAGPGGPMGPVRPWGEKRRK